MGSQRAIWNLGNKFCASLEADGPSMSLFGIKLAMGTQPGAYSASRIPTIDNIMSIRNATPSRYPGNIRARRRGQPAGVVSLYLAHGPPQRSLLRVLTHVLAQSLV